MSQIRSRWGNWRKRGTSTAVSVALVSAITASALVAFPPVATAALSAATATDPVAEGSKSEEDYALEQAAASGQPYELVSARTESTDTWALPDGAWSVKRHGTPVRLLRDGAWVPTDANLLFATDGSVKPKASTVDVTFSGGGTGPLLTGVKDGRTLSLTWPKALPKPTLAENVATYAEVLPGVDLQLKAEVEGFSQLLVVKTAAAAENPELASLKYKLGTVGLDVSTDAETGSLSAVNPAGQTVFTSPSPLMWDSSTVSSEAAPAARSAVSTMVGEEDAAPADVFDPPPGAQDAQMPTTITGDTLEIKPDQELLTGEDTQYPVFIDPSWAFGKKANWTRVYKHYPKKSYWNTKDVVRVGYESETGGTDRVSRSFFQLPTSEVKGAQVKSSVFRIRNTWSWSCENRPVDLYHVSPISSRTTWNNQPTKIGGKLATVDDSKGWSKDCAAGNLEFDTTAKIREAASKGWASITLGMYARDESDTFGWKKFDSKTAVLETVYNNPPQTPTGLGTNPSTSCSNGGLIGNASISLYATFNDRNAGNLTGDFQVFKTDSSTPTVPVVSQSIPATNGKVSTLVLPAGNVPSGEYTWQVRAKDQDGAASSWSAICKFSVDRARPSQAPVISSEGDTFPNGEQGWPSQGTGKAGSEGKFLFNANGVEDVESFYWWTDTDPEVRPAPKETAYAYIKPPSYGPHLIYAYSVDEAGNRSDTAVYLYYAARSQERDGPSDLNGDTTSDIWSIDSNGTLLTYAGHGDGTFSAATNAGKTFTDGQVGFRGDWGQDGHNDLVSLEYHDIEKKKRLWTYRNNGTGVINSTGVKELTVACPVKDPEMGCDYGEEWTGDDHWHNAEQVISAGDLNEDTQPDLLVKQGKQLWAYYGSRATYSLDAVREPVLVGGGDWDKFTVIAPGDLNGDAIPDLWLRDNTNGDLFRATGSKGPDNLLDPTTWGNPSQRVKIGNGFTISAWPRLGSVGDVNNDSIPDLWARKADNTMVGWPGVVTTGQFTGFGAAFTIDGITGGSAIVAGTQLRAGQSVTSRSATLTMRTDGNLVAISKANKVLWSSGTAGNPDSTARVEANGNIAVYSADGTSKLWSSGLTSANTPNLMGEGYALLQDKGSLVIYNAKGQSLWSNGSAIRNDVNGDGLGDMVDWYDYEDGHDALHVFKGMTDGGIAAPGTGYASTGNNWTASLTKKVHGDFNGDGRGDVAVMYYYPDYSHRLWTFLGQANGTYASPFSSWYSTGNRWGAISRSTLQSGDFNGDGRDDIAAWYDYSDGRDTLYTFTSDVRGGFNNPFASWTSTTWSRSMTKLTTGDFNGDGRDDIAGLYDYSAGAVKLWHFQAQPTGGFAAPTVAWTHDTWGDWDRTHAHAGDFNGDGKDDIATWFDYPDGSDKIHTYVSLSTGNGTFAPPKQAWSLPAGSITYQAMQMVPGDFNGDGLDDLGAMYGYSDGTVKMFTWLAKPDATFDPIKISWTSSTPTAWSYARTKFTNRYTT